VATLASVDETKLPMNYHWPSDRPEALHWGTIEAATTVCEQFLRARASATAPVPPAAPPGRAGG
jgi:hypothetical protein